MSIVTQVEGSIVASTSAKINGVLPEKPDGDGFFVIGTCYERCRTHNIKDASGRTHRFLAMPLILSFIRARVFDERTGKEVDTQLYSHTELRARGYLTLERSEKIDPYEFTLAEFVGEAIDAHEWAISALGPRVTLLAPDAAFRHAAPAVDEVVRVNTEGNSPLVASMTRMAGHEFLHYGGQAVGESYAGNVASRRALVDANNANKPLPGETLEGVDDDDEWENGGDDMAGDD